MSKVLSVPYSRTRCIYRIVIRVWCRVRLGSAPAGSFVCSFRFALSILCFTLSMNLLAQRVGMSVAIVCMVNHTAVALMRDAHSQSSNDVTGGNLTTTPPGEWQKNVSDDDASNRSPCAGNLVADSNRSVAMVAFIWSPAFSRVVRRMLD